MTKITSNVMISKRTPESGFIPGRFVRLLVLVGSILLLVLVRGGLLWQQRDQERIRAAIVLKLSSIRAAGHPLCAQDMASLFPDPPAEHDAYRLLTNALSLLSLPETTTNVPFFGDFDLAKTGPLDKPTIEEARKLIESNQVALTAVPWDRLEGAWFGCGFANGLTNLTLPRMTPLMDLIKLLCLDALLKAEVQQPGESMQRLQRALVLGRTLKDDLPIHSSLRRACEHRVCYALEWILNRTTVDDELLRGMAERFTITNAVPVIKAVLLYSRPDAMLVADVCRSQAAQLTAGVRSPPRLLLRAIQAHTLYRDRDLLHYLNWSERCLAALDWPMQEALPALLKIEKANRDLAKSRPVSFLNSWRNERISFMTMGQLELSQFLLPELAAVAKVREAVTAIAIKRWEASHGGQIPDSLSAIAAYVPGWVLEDPFNGQLLHYERLPRGFSLRSAGPDEAAKKLLPSYRGDEPYNITFHVEREPERAEPDA